MKNAIQRPAEYWIKKFPMLLRDDLIINTALTRKLGCKYHSMSHFIFGSMSWGENGVDCDFWDALHDSLIHEGK